MKIEHIIRILGNLLLLGLISVALFALWVRYQVDPLTRDGKVLADIVEVTPDVSGWVTELRIHDNEVVKKGQILLVLDQSRYQLALTQAEATLRKQQITLSQAEREDRRNHIMSNLVAAETIEEGTEHVDQLRMAVTQATAARDLARLNLERTYVRAPVDGTLSNITLQPGVYLTAGKGALALVYTKSLRVEGYFEETKMPAIHIGDKAEVRLMGIANVIQGHVESIAPGIDDRERTGSAFLLANVNPSFTWVRLAQRIPVRIAIDHVPPGMALITGQTATVQVLSSPDENKLHRRLPW